MGDKTEDISLFFLTFAMNSRGDASVPSVSFGILLENSLHIHSGRWLRDSLSHLPTPGEALRLLLALFIIQPIHLKTEDLRLKT